jgi:hypothetical protein
LITTLPLRAGWLKFVSNPLRSYEEAANAWPANLRAGGGELRVLLAVLRRGWTLFLAWIVVLAIGYWCKKAFRRALEKIAARSPVSKRMIVAERRGGRWFQFKPYEFAQKAFAPRLKRTQQPSIPPNNRRVFFRLAIAALILGYLVPMFLVLIPLGMSSLLEADASSPFLSDVSYEKAWRAGQALENFAFQLVDVLDVGRWLCSRIIEKARFQRLVSWLEGVEDFPPELRSYGCWTRNVPNSSGIRAFSVYLWVLTVQLFFLLLILWVIFRFCFKAVKRWRGPRA